MRQFFFLFSIPSLNYFFFFAPIYWSGRVNCCACFCLFVPTWKELRNVIVVVPSSYFAHTHTERERCNNVQILEQYSQQQQQQQSKLTSWVPLYLFFQSLHNRRMMSGLNWTVSCSSVMMIFDWMNNVQQCAMCNVMLMQRSWPWYSLLFFHHRHRHYINGTTTITWLQTIKLHPHCYRYYLIYSISWAVTNTHKEKKRKKGFFFSFLNCFCLNFVAIVASWQCSLR